MNVFQVEIKDFLQLCGVRYACGDMSDNFRTGIRFEFTKENLAATATDGTIAATASIVYYQKYDPKPESFEFILDVNDVTQLCKFLKDELRKNHLVSIHLLDTGEIEIGGIQLPKQNYDFPDVMCAEKFHTLFPFKEPFNEVVNTFSTSLSLALVDRSIKIVKEVIDKKVCGLNIYTGRCDSDKMDPTVIRCYSDNTKLDIIIMPYRV